MRLARIGIPAYYGRKLERENRAATLKTLTELDISKDQTSRSRSTVGSRLGYGSLDDLLWRGRPVAGGKCFSISCGLSVFLPFPSATCFAARAKGQPN